ncbi:MAG: response regulator [Candidatus Nanohaloarchaea archaeon]
MTTVLSIEDSGFERKVIQNALEEEGYEFVGASNAEEGLEKYEEVNPDLVLLDIRLPDKDGIDVLKELHEEYSDPKVIMVSIVREEETKEEAREIGAIDYVEKPVEEDELIEAIENAL